MVKQETTTTNDINSNGRINAVRENAVAKAKQQEKDEKKKRVENG